MKSVPNRQRLIEVTKKYRAIAICLLLMTVGIRLNADEKKDQVADANPIRIERRQVNIVVAAPKEQGHPCRVSIKIRCRVTNTAETPQQLNRRVPVLLGGWQVKPEDYRGHVDGKPVKLKVDQIRFSSLTNPDANGFGMRSPIPSPTKAQAAAWSKRLDNWMRQDPELRKLLDRFCNLDQVKTQVG
jgi:hypothetical protein